MWYGNIVQTAANANIVSGSDGNFSPNDSITRQEMTKMIIEALKYKTGKTYTSGKIDGFKDNKQISSWAVEYVKVANELGIIKGLTDDIFGPDELATRAQAVVIIKRLLVNLEAK